MAKKQFKAESKRLLDLMINSIYTHQEIFLREIISNASDAIDKLAYQALTDEKVGLSRSDFAIELKPDETARTLTVSDNGIGMDKDEMENNLGTICRSGSLQFKQALDKEKAADTDIIGQFGVGFYSAFMVADKVTVISKKYGSDEAWKWESEGADGYTMTPCERAAAGTDVIMQLKADTDDEKYSRFLKTWELQSLVRKYSDYIRYPIRMAVEKSRMKEGTEKSDKPEYETYTEVETLNSMVPIWNRNKKDVTDEEFNNFYKEKFFDFEDPQAGMFCALCVVGSVFSFPMFGSKCAPVQHMVNVLCAVLLGPWWGVGVAFVASLLRNLLGLGSLMAFPGSMFGALLCGLVYHKTKNILATVVGEVFGTSILGGLCAYPVAIFLMGKSAGDIAFYAYIVPFLISTGVGAVIAGILVFSLQRSGVLRSMQSSLS